MVRCGASSRALAVDRCGLRSLCLQSGERLGTCIAVSRVTRARLAWPIVAAEGADPTALAGVDPGRSVVLKTVRNGEGRSFASAEEERGMMRATAGPARMVRRTALRRGVTPWLRVAIAPALALFVGHARLLAASVPNGQLDARSAPAGS